MARRVLNAKATAGRGTEGWEFILKATASLGGAVAFDLLELDVGGVVREDREASPSTSGACRTWLTIFTTMMVWLKKLVLLAPRL